MLSDITKNGYVAEGSLRTFFRSSMDIVKSIPSDMLRSKSRRLIDHCEKR